MSITALFSSRTKNVLPLSATAEVSQNRTVSEKEWNEYQDQSMLLKALNRSLAIIEFQSDGTILTANDNFCDTVGYRHEEIVGRHHSMFVDQLTTKSTYYAKFWERLAAGEFQSGGFQRFARDGKEIWIQATYNPVFDNQGRVVKVVKLAVDITKQKQAAKDIQDRSTATIEFQPDGTIITANEKFLTSVGYSLSQIVGQHHRMFVPRDVAASLEYQRFWERLNRGEDEQGVFRRINSRGEEIWLQGAYNPILDNRGQVYRVVKTVTDITEQVAVREKTERMGNTIARSVTEMTTAIEEISQRVSRNAELARNAESNAVRAQQRVGELQSSSTTIGKVVSLIQDLAEQTNLLALNATIEAARAGESGRGFAVVASEVKELANQTARATNEIRGNIESIQASITDVVEVIQNIGSGITEVSTNTTSVASSVEEQSVLMGSLSSTANELLTLTNE
jgi:methyl-accepting chemotaxis protein